MFPICPKNVPVSSQLRFQSSAAHDMPLRESDHFVCVPSLGSILPGWVLISPKRPVMSMAQLSESENCELQWFFDLVRNDIEDAFGPSSAFEHGAQIAGSATGCGVDQAHLHIVPIATDLVLAEVASHLEWSSLSVRFPFDANVGSKEYLWLADRDRSYIAYPGLPTSQFFRRVIARLCDVTENWDYRVDPFHEHIAETRQALGRAARVPVSRAA